MQEPKFESKMSSEHEHNQEFKVSLINNVSSKITFDRELVPVGQDLLSKVQESEWISPENPDPFHHSLLEEVNCGDTVLKDEQEAVSGRKSTTYNCTHQSDYISLY